MSLIQSIFKSFSEKARAKRRKVFHENFRIDSKTRILDVGSEDGSNIERLIANSDASPENVYIADIDERAVRQGREKYGFNPVRLTEDGILPFEDDFFDIVYCSSTLEHATVPKDEIWSLRSGSEFRRRSQATQKRLADEIKRVGKSYFVQIPCRTFLVESHSWLPLAGILPRTIQVTLFSWTNKFWFKKTIPDFYLNSRSELIDLFPDAEIITEKKFGFTKSLMAIGRSLAGEITRDH